MRHHKPLLVLATLVMAGGLSIALWPSNAVAQSTSSQVTIKSLTLENTDVREALRQLFKQTNVSFSIAPDVQGTVTLSLQNVTLDVALTSLLRQVDAKYSATGKVYQVVRSNAEFDNVTQVPSRPERQENAMLVDGKLLFVLKGGKVYKLDKDSMTVLGSANLD